MMRPARYALSLPRLMWRRIVGFDRPVISAASSTERLGTVVGLLKSSFLPYRYPLDLGIFPWGPCSAPLSELTLWGVFQESHLRFSAVSDHSSAFPQWFRSAVREYADFANCIKRHELR